MKKKYYYKNEKGEEIFRKVKYYSDIKDLYKHSEKIYQYKVDNIWTTKNDEQIDECEIMLYTPKELEKDELFLMCCEEEVDFLNKKGFTATTFWTHNMCFEELAPMIPKLFGDHKKIYIVSTLIDILNYGTDRMPPLYDKATNRLGNSFLEELSKICEEIIIIDVLEYMNLYNAFPTIVEFLENKNCDINDKEKIYNELMKKAEKYEDIKKRELAELNKTKKKDLKERIELIKRFYSPQGEYTTDLIRNIQTNYENVMLCLDFNKLSDTDIEEMQEKEIIKISEIIKQIYEDVQKVIEEFYCICDFYIPEED